MNNNTLKASIRKSNGFGLTDLDKNVWPEGLKTVWVND